MSQSILVRCGDDIAPFYETPTWLTRELLSLTGDAARFKRYYEWLELEKKESYRSMAEHFLKLGDWFSKYANKTITWETT